MTTRQIRTSTDLDINSPTGTLSEEITHQLGEHTMWLANKVELLAAAQAVEANR